MQIAAFIGDSPARKEWVEHACALYAAILLKNQEAVMADTPDALTWFDCATAFQCELEQETVSRN